MSSGCYKGVIVFFSQEILGRVICKNVKIFTSYISSIIILKLIIFLFHNNKIMNVNIKLDKIIKIYDEIRVST